MRKVNELRKKFTRHNKNKIKTYISLIIILITTFINICYAGFFAGSQYIEVDLENYSDNEILIKDIEGKILESNSNFSDGTSSYGELKIEKSNKIRIEAVDNIGYSVLLKKIIIEITDNNGKINTLEIGSSRKYIDGNNVLEKIETNKKTIFMRSTSKDHEACYLKYNCENGKVTDITFWKTNKNNIIKLIIIILGIIGILVVLFLEKRKRRNLK